jgi:hypothetical protein
MKMFRDGTCIHVLAIRVHEFRTKTKLTNFVTPSPVVRNRSSHAGRPHGSRLI